MLVIHHGETPLVNCGPRSIFYIWNTIYCNHLLSAFLTSNFHHPHYTINPLWSTSRWDWQLHCYVGAKFLGCVVRRCLSKSYWFDNLGFFLRENLLIYSSYFLLGVSQRACDLRTSKLFFGAVARDLRHIGSETSTPAKPLFWRHCKLLLGATSIKLLQGESHTSNLFFVYCLA